VLPQSASRELGRYFSRAHSAAAVHPHTDPFAHDRLWTLDTEKADMNSYFDKLAKKTESHIAEIRHLHSAGISRLELPMARCDASASRC
jgi:hypothetical protein